MKFLPILLFISVLCMSFSGVAESPANLERLKREVTIFQRVVSTALQHDTRDQISSVAGSYLAGQGVVIDISLRGNNRFNWRKHIEGMRELHGLSDIPSPSLSRQAKSTRCSPRMTSTSRGQPADSSTCGRDRNWASRRKGGHTLPNIME